MLHQLELMGIKPASVKSNLTQEEWKKEELEIVFDNKELQIKGKKEHKLGDDEEFIHQGLSLKSFERRFILNADLLVDKVSLQDGLLTIALSRTPNSKRKILEIDSEIR